MLGFCESVTCCLLALPPVPFADWKRFCGCPRPSAVPGRAGSRRIQPAASSVPAAAPASCGKAAAVTWRRSSRKTLPEIFLFCLAWVCLSGTTNKFSCFCLRLVLEVVAEAAGRCLSQPPRGCSGAFTPWRGQHPPEPRRAGEGVCALPALSQGWILPFTGLYDTE